jgi:hypothetical protein
MKTKTSSRPSKKTSRSTAASARGRAAQATTARPKLKGASAKKPAGNVKTNQPKAKMVDRDKYQQSGAPWWKAFL